MPSSETTGTTDTGGLQSIAALLSQFPKPAPQSPARRRATGFRRFTPASLEADKMAESFAGLPDGLDHHAQLLAALKAAAPLLGLSPRMVHAVDWLFKFTMPQDWRRGARPIVWPSASLRQEALGLSLTRTKAINRALIAAGVITMNDSANGKRHGRRDSKGRIVEAYGFDLSPIAARYAEFVQLAAKAKADRQEMGDSADGRRSPATGSRRSLRRPPNAASRAKSG